MRERQWMLLLVALLLAAFTIAGCNRTDGAGTTPPADKKGITLTLAGEDYGYPSPYGFYPRGPGYVRMSLVFDTLVWKDEKGLIPWLAQNWHVSEDGRVWTFDLADNIRWQDGKSLTAGDVAFTYEYLVSHPHPWFSREVKGVVERVEAQGDKRVIFYLSRPYAPFLNNVAATVPVLPRHVWADIADPAACVDARAVMGSGPFRLAAYDKAAGTYQFEANPDYFRGVPTINRLVFVQVGQPLMALQKGEIDGFSPDGDQVALLKNNSNIKIREGNSFWIYRLLFNMGQEVTGDIRFRQAVAHALNLPELVERAVRGGALPGSPGYVSPELAAWYCQDVNRYPHNPEKSRSLLAAMGYDRLNSQGIRENAAGQRLSLEMIAFQQGQDAEIIKQWLAAVGIEVRIRALEKGAHDKLIDAGQYQMAINGHGGIGGDPIFLNQLAGQKDNPAAAALYQRPEYLELAATQTGQTKAEERRQSLNRMQMLLAEELPTLPLYYRKNYFAFRPGKVDNWFYTAGGIAMGIPTEMNKLVFLSAGGIVR